MSPGGGCRFAIAFCNALSGSLDCKVRSTDYPDRIRVYDGDVAGTWVETSKLTEDFFSASGQRAARFNPRSEFATSLPVFGCCARGTAKRLREMALVGETRLERDKRNGFPAT